MRFIAELRRRHVFRAVAGYAVVAFVVLQAGEIILPAFEAPAWVLQLLVVLAALGFPVVLVVAWVYALTPSGLERTADLDREAGMHGQEPSVLPQIGLAVATLVVLGGLGLWMVRQPAVDAAQPDEAATNSLQPVDAEDMRITSIAVLPLDDFSPDGGQEYFAASMHEEILAQLSRESSLRVVSRTSVTRYAGSELGAPEIGAELGVQGIVEGSVTRAGDRVRITVQLIHAPSDTHLWADSYEREMKDILALQAEVAGEVVKAIQGEVEAAAQPERLASVAPVDPEAMDAYMQAHYQQEQGTPEALEAAEAYFTRAIGIDSTFAPAMAGLAGTHFLMGIHGDSVSPEQLIEARQTAEAALRMDAASDEARAVLLAVDERLAGIEGLGDRIQVDLRLGEPMDTLEQEYLRRFTDFGRLARNVMIVRSGDPERLPTTWTFGAAQGMMSDGHFDQAAEMLEVIVEKDPGFVGGWDALERTYVMQGDFERVVETRRRRIEELSDEAEATEVIAALGEAVAAGGSQGYWEWLRDDHRERQSRGEYASEVEYAAACVALGEYEDALNALEAGLAKRERQLVSLRSDPVWDPLRQDPRFQQIQAAVRKVRRPPVPGGAERPRLEGRQRDTGPASER